MLAVGDWLSTHFVAVAVALGLSLWIDQGAKVLQEIHRTSQEILSAEKST
jgi:hypothetical protein